MTQLGEWIRRDGARRAGIGAEAGKDAGGMVLATSGHRSPWGEDERAGAGEGDSPEASEGEAGAAESAAGDAPEAPASEPRSGAAKSGSGNDGASDGAPRNPWSPAPDKAPPPRRSASIDDIFRARKDAPRGPGGGSGSGGGFGGLGGGLGGLGGKRLRLPLRPDGKSWLPLIGLALLVVWGFTSMHELDSTEQGIVTNFGKYEGTIGPGLNITPPWPFADVAVTDVTSIRRDSIPEGDSEKLMLTSDQNLVDLSYLVRWSVKDLKLYSFQLDDPDAAVRDVAEAAMRASVSEVKLSDVMGGAGRAYIEESVRARMQAILDAYHAGVMVQGVDIKKADPPDRVNDAFQQVSAAQQEASRDVSRAQGFAQQVVARARGDAGAFDRIYAQYKLAPDVTRRRMYYDTMERVLSNNDKVILEGNTTSYLPLPEVKRGAAPQDASSAQSGDGQ